MKRLLVVIAVGVVLCCSRYDYQKDAEGRPVRINKITGKTEVLSHSQWRPVDEQTASTTKATRPTRIEQPVPADVLWRLPTRVSVRDGTAILSVDNTSAWEIHRLVVSVSAGGSPEEFSLCVGEGSFACTFDRGDSGLRPGQSGTFSGSLFGHLHDRVDLNRVTVRIASGTGWQ